MASVDLSLVKIAFNEEKSFRKYRKLSLSHQQICVCGDLKNQVFSHMQVIVHTIIQKMLLDKCATYRKISQSRDP